MNLLRQQWFLFGLFAACTVGYFLPQIGQFFRPAVWILVAIIMFLVGLGQDVRELIRSVQNYRALLFTIFTSFTVFPALGYLTGYLLFPDSPVLLAGVMIMTAVPTTVVSSVVWSQSAGGNTALSLVLVVASTLSSLVLLPIILILTLGHSIELPVWSMMGKLTLIIITPVAAAQLIKKANLSLKSLERISPKAGQGLILVLVLTAVADSVNVLSLSLVGSLVIIVVLLNTLISILSFYGSGLIGLPDQDQIAVLFAASQKTITVGLLVGLVYFDGRAGLPVLIYHVFQQFTGYLWSHFLGRSPATVETFP